MLLFSSPTAIARGTEVVASVVASVVVVSLLILVTEPVSVLIVVLVSWFAFTLSIPFCILPLP